MDPITMMRNALGKKEGGSGVKLDHEKYMESVKFWDENASIEKDWSEFIPIGILIFITLS